MVKKEQYDVIVIGGGIGGLGCAALLGKRGLKTLLLEQNERTGGRIMGFSEKGFKYELWNLAPTPAVGNNIEVLSRELGLEPGIKIVPPKKLTVAYRGRSGKWGIDNDVRVFLPGRDPDPTSLFKLWEMDDKETEQAVKVLTELCFMPPEGIDALDQTDISLEECLAQYEVPWAVYNYFGALSAAIVQMPIDAISAAEFVKLMQDCYLRGAGGYAAGGFGSVVDQLTSAVHANGVELRTGVKVDRITVEGGRVTGVVTKQGEEIKCPIVISSAGLQPTVLKLAGEEHFDKGYVNFVKDLVEPWGWTGQVYFLSRPVVDFDMCFVYADDSWWDTERFAKVREEQDTHEVNLFAAATSNYSPDVAPPGKQLLIVGTNCSCDPKSVAETEMLMDKADELLFKLFPEIEPAIEEKKRAGQDQVAALFRDSVLPGQGGSWGGVALAVGQSGRKRPSSISPINGLFYVGLDVGGGQMGIHLSSGSAMDVARIVDRYHRRKVMSK